MDPSLDLASVRSRSHALDGVNGCSPDGGPDLEEVSCRLVVFEVESSAGDSSSC